MYLLVYDDWVWGLGVVLYSLWYCVDLGGFDVLVVGLFNSVLLCLLGIVGI